jgi:hypothetical protein
VVAHNLAVVFAGTVAAHTPVAAFVDIVVAHIRVVLYTYPVGD